MTHPQFDQEPSASAGQRRQQLIRQFRIIRRSAAGVWLLLVFGWYGLHSLTVWPIIGPEGKISILVLTILILIVFWAVAWVGWWIWVPWPIPVVTTLTAALCLWFLIALAVSFPYTYSQSPPPVDLNLILKAAAAAAAVLWAIVMNVLGAGAARSLILQL